MRKRFEQQFSLGQLRIEDTFINPKHKFALEELCAALKEIYCNPEYNEKIFCILDEIMDGKNKNTGRPGMDLWTVFVLSQVRLCLNFSYEAVHNLANYHSNLRQIMGVERESGFGRVEFEYQQIYDNVSKITDDMLKRINDVIVEFGHKEIFKKKETTALHLKTDSFVLETNVHFPTDYNLLWDCIRKCLDMTVKYEERHPEIEGWRKRKSWRRDLKSLMRSLGRVSSKGGKNKEERMKDIAGKYLSKSNLLLLKLKEFAENAPIYDEHDLSIIMSLIHYIKLMDKHIDLVERRIIKEEDIPHEEKMFSIFEPHTEWITKGKSRPNVELGKKVNITTDQWNLIIDYCIMDHEQDREIVIRLADIILPKFKVSSWSFDKGYWNKTVRDLLRFEVKDVIMPKLGKLSQEDKLLENSKIFKNRKNKHSAVESNINELEHRGLDRCPDKGKKKFSTYVGLAVCSYNLKKIGREILRKQWEAEKLCKQAA